MSKQEGGARSKAGCSGVGRARGAGGQRGVAANVELAPRLPARQSLDTAHHFFAAAAFSLASRWLVMVSTVASESRPVWGGRMGGSGMRRRRCRRAVEGGSRQPLPKLSIRPFACDGDHGAPLEAASHAPTPAPPPSEPPPPPPPPPPPLMLTRKAALEAVDAALIRHHGALVALEERVVAAPDIDCGAWMAGARAERG